MGARSVSLFRRLSPQLFAKNRSADFAVADAKRTGRGPAVREKPRNRIPVIDFAKNGRHLLGEIRAEHARRVKPRGLRVLARRAIAIALKPFRMRLESFFVGEIAIHPRDDADAAFDGRSNRLSKKVAGAQKPASVVIRQFSRIKGHDSPAIEQHRVGL